MGFFNAKCEQCEKTKIKYKLKLLSLETKNFLLPFFNFKQVTYQHIYIYKYECSNNHIFNSTMEL
jgi:hypothetical protein